MAMGHFMPSVLMLALSAVSAPAIAMAEIAPEFEGDPTFRTRRGKGQNNRRGKGKRTPPKGRTNRLHLSKRVRRKHRRAA